MKGQKQPKWCGATKMVRCTGRCVAPVRCPGALHLCIAPVHYAIAPDWPKISKGREQGVSDSLPRVSCFQATEGRTWGAWQIREPGPPCS